MANSGQYLYFLLKRKMKNNHCLFTLILNSDFGLYIIIFIQSFIKDCFKFLLESYVLRLAIQHFAGVNVFVQATSSKQQQNTGSTHNSFCSRLILHIKQYLAAKFIQVICDCVNAKYIMQAIKYL